MQKTSGIFNFLTILLSLGAFGIVLLIWFDGNDALSELSSLNKKYSELEAAAEDQNKSQAANLARAKRKNAEILKEISKIKQDTTSEQAELITLEADLESSRDQLAQTRDETHQANLSAEELKKKLEQTKLELNRLTAANPAAVRELETLRQLIEDERARGVGIQDELKDYEDETRTLDHHYKSILVALEKDLNERPWIERGETILTSIQNLNLRAGVLMIPLGKNDGLRDDMRFLVSEKGRSLCRIKLKDIGLSHSVAMIIPMFGRVARLQESQKVEITNL